MLEAPRVLMLEAPRATQRAKAIFYLTPSNLLSANQLAKAYDSCLFRDILNLFAGSTRGEILSFSKIQAAVDPSANEMRFRELLLQTSIDTMCFFGIVREVEAQGYFMPAEVQKSVSASIEERNRRQIKAVKP